MLKHRGYTLIETLIALTIGAGIVSAAGVLVSTSLTVNTRIIQSSRLNEELGNIASLITADIQRAGFSAAASDRLHNQAITGSPFNQPVYVGAFGGEPANSCVVFTYDSNSDGELNLTEPNEYFGYRLRDNSIEVRRAGALCEEPGWEDLTDNDIVKVTALHFAVTTDRINRLNWQTVALHIAGELVANPQFQRQYTQSVRVANAYY